MQQHEALERGVRHNPGSMIVFGVLGTQYVFIALSDGMSLSNTLYLNHFLSAVVLYICVAYREFIMTCQEAVFHTAWQKIKPDASLVMRGNTRMSRVKQLLRKGFLEIMPFHLFINILICNVNVGKYAHLRGSITCTGCSPGTSAASDGSKYCQACPKGRFQSALRESECSIT